jgi:hypothetical protein
MTTHIEMERRHAALVVAVHEAIATLKAPFSENDYIPGTIQDAIAILKDGLKP